MQCVIYDKKDKESLPILEVLKTISGPATMTICQDLRRGNPPIYLGRAKVQERTLLVQPLHLDQKAAARILERIHQNFS